MYLNMLHFTENLVIIPSLKLQYLRNPMFIFGSSANFLMQGMFAK